MRDTQEQGQPTPAPSTPPQPPAPSARNIISISNLRLSFNLSWPYTSATRASTPASQGLDGRKTLESRHGSSTLCTKGSTAIILPARYASTMVALTSRSRASTGLLRPRVRRPSQDPRFLSRERSPDCVITRSDPSSTRTYLYVATVSTAHRPLSSRASTSCRYKP